MTKRFFLSLIFVFHFYTAAHARVQFHDLYKQDLNQIKKLYPEAFDSAPKLSLLDDVIRYLVRLETYSSVQLIKNSDDQYSIVGVPLKKVGEIRITGTKALDQDDVLAALSLKSGSRFDSGRILEAGERIKEFYGRNGYFNTIVSFDFQEMNNNELRVLVNVRERKPCLISDVIINTTNDDLKAKLRRRYKKYIDRNFTEENIANIEGVINEYLADHRYVNSKLMQSDARYNSAKTSVKLIYELTDPYGYEILISGTQFYESYQVLRNIEVNQITRGTSDPGQDISQMIRNFYVRQGFPNVKVSFRDRVIERTFTKQILVEVDEGKRVRIDSIDVVGHISRPSKYYSEFIRKNSSEMIMTYHFVRDDLENGNKNLITYLNNQGFLKAKVQSTRVEYNDKKDKVKVTVVLDEGPLTQLSKVNFYGIRAFTREQLMEQMTLKNNSPLRLNELEVSIENLKKFYHNRGYIEMKILNEDETLVQYDERGLQASLDFKIEEGPQVYVKSIYIEGNSFTKDYVLLREANIDIGDLLTPEVIDEAKKRLDKLAIFSRVEIRTLEANTSVSQRTVVISVTESNPGLFKFGAGITNKRQLTARGFAGLSYNNIGGTARAVSIRGTVEKHMVEEKYLGYEFNVGYLEPFLLGKRIRGRTGYTRSEKITDNDNNIVQALDRVNFTLEKDITSKIKLSWLLWGFDSVEQFTLLDNGDLKRDSRQQIAYVGPILDIDYRDNPFLPTEGTYTKFDAEYSSPSMGSSEKIEFVKTEGTFTHYFRLGSPKIIWANSVRGGYEKNLNKQVGSGIPLSYAFFLGGYNTIRGYSGADDDRIPSSSEFPIPKDQLIIPSESTYYLVKSEIRFPLWKEPFGGVIFYDGGQVDLNRCFNATKSGVQDCGFEHPYRQSAGVGFRINTPVGPISVDYARKIAPLPKESPDQWHVFIGTF